MNILFLTGSYPYAADREESFIYPEMATLDFLGLMKNKTVNLYLGPKSSQGPLVGGLPDLIHLVDWFYKRSSRPVDVLKVVTKLHFYNGVVERARFAGSSRFSVMTDLRSIAGWSATYCKVLSGLKANLPRIGGNWGLYTYWFDGGTSACIDYRDSTKNLQGNHSIKWVVTRAHGIDLYDNRIWHPRRGTDIERLDRVYTVSKAGRDYLVNHYGNPDKIKCCHLGIQAHIPQEKEKHKASPTDGLKIVSCAMMQPLKRVPLLCESLIFLSARSPEQKVLWVHFGSGQDETLVTEILSHRKPPNLTVELRGNVSNVEVRRSLRDEYFDCFVTLSETEGGVPVSLQEAAEAGIPMIGTNVGGIPEIVNENTGFLLSSDPNIAEVADAIELVTGDRHSQYRKGAREIWRSSFDAIHNHGAFYQSLLQLQ